VFVCYEDRKAFENLRSHKWVFSLLSPLTAQLSLLSAEEVSRDAVLLSSLLFSGR
jgi:hypothetical protein